MRFGVLLDHQYDRGDDLGVRLPELVDFAQTVRDLGFDSLFGIHHYLSNLRTLQPLTLLAHLVDHTGSMQIGTGIYIVPLTHPVQLAEEVATLDQLSGGRFVLGAGAGYRNEEFAAFGIPRGERTPRLVESLELMTRLWSGEPVTHAGAHYCVDDVSLSMLPVQRPHPPIWIGANSPRAIERAARLGYPWLASGNVKRNWAVGNLEEYRRVLVDAGHTDEGRTYPIHRDLSLADTRKAAIAQVEPYVRRSYGQYTGYGLDYFETMFEDFKAKSFFFDTPDGVVARIEDFAASGFNHFVFRVQWLGCPRELSLEILERFAREVMPRFRGRLAAPAAERVA
jgi:alkanesulfonate monooxygenase SsuD/methylene tetrahydromethanopterin reductase-like flavin-dependent oxidoreductase (luciferase family)